MRRKIPKFKSAEEAALFWENHEILDFYDPDEFKIVKPQEEKKLEFSKPKREKVLISIRLDKELLDKAKEISSKKHLSYQTLLRQWIWESSQKSR